MPQTDTPPENQSADSQLGGSASASVARQSTLFSPRIKIAVVALLVVAGLTYFAWSAFASATVNYSRVDEIASGGPTAEGTTVGIIGKLVENSYTRSADGVSANFRLIDEDDGIQEMQVRYKGEIGQVFFNDHSEIILQGRMGNDNVFEAETLTVRCPSKYLTEAEQAEIDAQNGEGGTGPSYQPDYFDQKN